MHMKFAVIVLAIAGLVGCTSTKAPDVTSNIHNSLQQAGLRDVSVSQDRDKGVVTLGGHVTQQADKDRAAQIAQSVAAGQTVANEIAVLPAGAEATAKSVNADMDKGIENNLDAALTQAGIKGVRHDTKNGVVTLKGDVETPARRAEAERVAASVPNVQQVVNELDVRNRRARSSGDADRSR
jgi:hyperosmotically inducible periplasmic protein